ncbi:MAG: hypothetical protein ACLTKE_09655 [Coprococcus sp.]
MITLSFKTGSTNLQVLIAINEVHIRIIICLCTLVAGIKSVLNSAK